MGLSLVSRFPYWLPLVPEIQFPYGQTRLTGPRRSNVELARVPYGLSIQSLTRLREPE